MSGELEGLPEQPAAPEESLFGDPHTRRPAQPPPPGQAPSQSPPEPPEPESILPLGGISPAHIQPSEVNTPPPQPPIQSQTRPTLSPIQQPQAPRNAIPPPPPPAAPVPPPQLTPKQIAQAQKHCRFAISALDYEDFERARQDLLDALKIIGG